MSLLKKYVLYLLLFSAPVFGETDFHHFAFANYLGSGLYHASGQNTTVFNIPFSYDLIKNKTQKITARAPISMGFFNFSLDDLPNEGIPQNIGTMTLIPGILYEDKKTSQFTYQVYFDLGYGKNFSTGDQVGIYSSGISSIINLQAQHYDPVWVSRFYFSGYQSLDSDINDSYSALQTGIDLGFGSHNYSSVLDVNIEPRLFAAGYLYFDRLKLVSPFQKHALLSNSVEVGASLVFSKPILWDWMGINRISIGYRVGNDVTAWRLAFGFPI